MTTPRDFRKLDVAIVVLSAITYLIDVATDVLVTVQYMFEGELMWFTLTLAFIVVPMVLMQVFSLKWYLSEANARISFIGGFLHSIGLALLKRYANVLMTWSDVKTSADPALIEKLFLQINDVFLLRLFQCFLESAPQLILHTYVAVSQWYITISSGFSIFFSLLSLAWGFATYTDILRLTYRDSYHRKWSGLLLQVGWQTGMVISRVMAIVMFGICFQGWLFLPIAVHWLLMTIWIMTEKTNFTSHWWEDKLYSCVVGFIYIFCFLNVQEGRTRWRMFFFYALQMLENTLIVITWMLVDNSMEFIYQWLFTAIVYIGFLGGVVCLLLFYGCYHPDKQDDDNSSVELGPEQSKLTFQSLQRSSKRGQVSSSSITSNTSLMDKDGKQSVYQPLSYRKEPIGCQDVSADIRFLKINDGTPSFGSIGKFPAFNHGMLQDEEDVDESATKIFTSTTVDEETPRALKFVKRTAPQNILKTETLLAGGQTRGEPKKLSSKFSSSMSQPGLFSKGPDREVKITPHIGYSPEKGYMLKLTSPPPCRDARNCHTLGRHHSENIGSTTQVSTVDNLSQKYQHFRESWDGSDRYLQMLERYCDREDQPIKYTYLNSVYEPTTKPMERKNKVSPLTKLRSSFRRHIDAMRNLNYKEMSPVLNPKQYFSSRDSLKSNPGPTLLQCQNLPLTEAYHSGENQHGMFYNACHPKDHIGNSQESAFRGPQSCAGSSQCHRHCQGYEQTSFCDHGYAHKRRSYTENFPDNQQVSNATYCTQKPTHPENTNPPNDQALSYYTATDRCGYYNQPTHLSYLTLPHKPNNFPSGHSASSAFAQCYPTLRKPQGPYPPNHNYPSNDQSTYVVYSEKPTVSRCTSAPPHLPQNYGSLRRNAIAGSRKTPDDALVDHNDFRYCTVSSVRSESAPPNENFIRASFRSQRGLKLKSDSFKSNQEAAAYDFRQLTVSPVQSMSVPPDKANDLEALRNLTVSPVRSVSVMPNQSTFQEQEYFNNYSQPSKRPTSVPPNYFQTYNPSNFPVPRVATMSDSPDTSFSYSTGADRPTTPSSSHCCSDNYIYGKMTVCPDGMVSIPPAPSNSKTVSPSFDSAGHNHSQDEVSDSAVFSYKRPYLPDIKLSVPYSPTQSDISLDSDSQSIISFSSLPDSTSESLPRDRTRVNRNFEKESSETDPQFYEDQNKSRRKTSNHETKHGKNGIAPANGVSQHETVKEEFNQSHHPETSKTNSSDPKPPEKYQDPLKNTNKHKSMKKMSSHVHRGVSIEPSSSDNQTAQEDDPKENQHISSLEKPQENQDDPSFTIPLKPPQPTPINLQEEIIKKSKTINNESVSSGSEPNLSGIFNHQFTQSYAKIDPNQFSLQKFRDCTRSELYSPGISKTSTKKISSVDFYNKSKPNKNSSENSFYPLSSPELERRDGAEQEKERKKPQIPKNLPEEKPKGEQLLKTKNATLSPLTIKQLKSSPLKLGRSLSISSGDKSRLSKLRDKLSPLRIQNLVHSPFKFGRNIDLFDRKRWRSANDIVEESNVEKKTCLLVKNELLKSNKAACESLSEKNKSTPKSKESVSSVLDREAFNAKYLHGEDSETDSDPSGLGTLMDCDWAHDVLDQLSRISDQHGSSFSDDSLKFTKFASWTDLTNLPKQEVVKGTSDEKGDLEDISKPLKEVKMNETDTQETMEGAEEAVNKKNDLSNLNLNKNQTLSLENEFKTENISNEILQGVYKSGKSLKENISKADNTNKNQKNSTNIFEEMAETSAKENSVAEELDSKNEITYQEFEETLRNSKQDIFSKENNQTFIVSQDTSDETLKQEFSIEEANTNCSYQCEGADSTDSTDHDSNKSMIEKLEKSQSPPKTRTKTYNAGKTTDPKRSRRQNQERGNKCRKKLSKELSKNNKINAIYKNLYHDVELSVVHEDLISVRDDTQYIQNMACWENWDKYEDDNNDDENLERFKNNLIRETLTNEMSYPWESSITDSDENSDSSREGAGNVLDKAFLSDDDKYDRKTNSYWPRSRYPKTVSRPVDPLLMPTIHEYRIMTEQFVYDDDEDNDETESYHFNDPQLTVPAYELYDDRRSKVNKYSSYFREKSLQSVNDTHSPMYMTVPMRDSSRAWHSRNHKNFLEEFFPKSETESSESHAFL